MQHDSQTRLSPAATGLSRTSQNTSSGKVSTTIDAMRALYGRPLPPATSAIDRLLPALENVRHYGKGYRADCPRGHSSKGSLSLASGDDGRVLLTCFAGCSAAEIVSALGLQVADLFPARLAPQTPQDRRELAERARLSQWGAALGVLDREATVVLIAAGYADRGERLPEADQVRLREACDRITRAREVLRGGR